MAAPKLATNHSPIIGMERKASVFAAASTLAGAGFSIPANAGEIHCEATAAMHWTPVGTATSTFAHPVAANKVFVLTHAQHGASIIGDAGAITLTVAYMKGSGAP